MIDARRPRPSQSEAALLATGIDMLPAGRVVLREHDTNDTMSPACDIVKIQPLAILFALGSVSAANGEPQMRKALTALIAIVALAFAGVLVAAPKATKSTQDASTANAGIDIFSLTRRAQTLPEQSYPAH